MHQRRYRIYLRYYAGGDLESALGWGDVNPDPNRIERPQAAPERFIWHVLQSLVNACRVLQTGFDEPLAEGEEELFANWKPLTHLDIGLRNIFIVEAGNLEADVSCP